MLFDFGDGEFRESRQVRGVSLKQTFLVQPEGEESWNVWVRFEEWTIDYGPFGEDEAKAEMKKWAKAINAMNGCGGASPLPGDAGGPSLRRKAVEKTPNALSESPGVFVQ